MKTAIITGTNGQDGSILAEILLERGYLVHGLIRRSSGDRIENIAKTVTHPNFELTTGDVTDAMFMSNWINTVEPNEIYHEADQDHVGTSFDVPAYSVDITIKSVVNLLEIVRVMRPHFKPKVFLPSSATIFGSASGYLDEFTPLDPQSPYAVAKAAVLHLGNLYRNVYGLKITTGILCNHDSDRRNGTYLLHDIARIAVECSLGRREDTGIRFSNIEHEVSVGEARKFMEVVHRLTSEGFHENYVIGSQYRNTIEGWIRLAFSLLTLDYRDYLVNASQPNRPGKPETLIPCTSKFEAHLNCPSITTDQFALMQSLITKYQKELT